MKKTCGITRLLHQLLRSRQGHGICKIYEEFLKKQNPSMASITYDVSHLYEFIDKLSDLSCLILNTETCQYVPHNKDWIKEKIFVMLRTQARND
ncbi:enhancer of rudimentary [Teladorsagia circumcincta]|uniref:Enhancer of rudimentary n=1 Tax=Teladorsagia circumcincta TaxID=45464 RepID=A0A2G9UF33_TELCI|nr:enhancer of rudimentary [Teladorsagia circumcincta]